MKTVKLLFTIIGIHGCLAQTQEFNSINDALRKPLEVKWLTPNCDELYIKG